MNGGLIRQRPFRAPHYSASVAALIGGGTDNIMPGEISLSHNGILFIDEFCEAPKKVLEVLRAPMEDKKVTISRLRSKVEYPSDFMLIAATNPCPCGYYGVGDRCTCTPGMRMSYMAKLSGPLMDRIDLQLIMKPIDPKTMMRKWPAESTAEIAERVRKARERQKERLASEEVFCNAGMNNRMIEKYCNLDSRCSSLLEKLIDKAGFSARACSRIIKLARTIADLEGAESIMPEHIAEAAGYRILDKLG